MLATAEAERKVPDLSDAMGLMSLKFSNEIAQGWGGDRLIVLGKADARVLILVTCWDTPRDAAELYGAMRALHAQLDRALKPLMHEGKFGKHPSAGASLEYGEAHDEVVLVTYYG